MFHRHDLLQFSPQAAQQIFLLWQAAQPHDWLSSLPDWQRSFNAGDIPGIVRRHLPAEAKTEIALGFSFPMRIDGQRQRFAITLPAQEVVRRITPFEAAAMAFLASSPALGALVDLRERFLQLGCLPGVWGSAALQIVSGFSYTDNASDLDIVIEACHPEQLQAVYQSMLQLERQHRLRIDTEVLWPTGYGSSLKELMTSGNQVLGKSLNDVRLFDKTALLSLVNKE
ncbi:hypothetical protein Z042_24810 [Chania multitudinisentens RB-25]|uniref:Phosphoribosyl-dephospho-CoA transferase n=2 Tax=Chania TaxID=1745211 RepID=W0LLU0_9GAMM|nr:hypothetical protein Z042_24810 [Chania multitudinisentens RB-25]